MANPANDEPRKKITAPVLQREKLNLMWGAMASVVSILAHVILAILVLFINVDVNAAPAGEVGTTVLEEADDSKQLDLTNIDVGIDSKVELNYNVDRIEDVSVPGMVNPMDTVGLENTPENAIRNIPLPPGAGGGTGKAADSADPGNGNLFGTLGGMGGIYVPGGFGGRSAATREKMALEGGGNALSEAAVAQGLLWLALHQGNEGNWSLVEYNRMTREKPLGQPGKVFEVTGGDKDGNPRENRVAATAFALLPFLAAGQTHKFNKENKIDYSKTVRGGLDWLIKRQGKDGAYGDGFYAHGVATIVMGEAYGMTSDPMLKASALNAMKYLITSQHDGGGWRYGPREPGDLSVTGWQVMGLKSCEMAGLTVPKDVMLKVDRYLDSVYDEKSYGFKYTSESGVTPTMTAVGMLCRLYRGINPRNPAILKGVDWLKKRPPAQGMSEFYYSYYATQVMHHMGGEAWDFWNLGPSGTGKDGMRDLLIKAQDKGDNPKKPFQGGSWAPTGSFHDGNTRVIATSMALLMLEVYYRHLPLYRRDLGVTKEMPQ
jgi:hypothetical protein